MFADLLGDPPSKLNSKSVSPTKDVYKKKRNPFTCSGARACYLFKQHPLQQREIPQSADAMNCTPTDMANKNSCHIDMKAETKG